LSEEGGSADLVDAIYGAGFEPESWPAALSGIMAALGANSACFATCEVTDNRIVMLPIGVDARTAAEYTQHYARIDPLIPAVLTGAPGRAYNDLMVLPRHEMERTEIYCDWAVPNGIRSAAAIVLQHDAARIVTLAMMRERRGDEFAPATLHAFEHLAKHVRRALTIQRRLGAARGSPAALDHFGDGVLLVAPPARVLYSNRAAEELLADGDPLRSEHGALSCRRPRDTSGLLALIAGTGGAMRLLRGGGRAPLNVVVTPGPPGRSPLDFRHRSAFVFVSDPEHRLALSAERLRTLFGLTRMQAAFAQEIARGDGIDSAAARLGISRATARTHLAEIFAKTRTSRQAELVRVLLQSVPNLRG
jgi:DNA-binding CsgD family transcriptional regulator